MAGNSENQAASVADTETRVIKRYSNRKLYDTKDSSYVTLQQIGEMVRRGENVRIIDNKTKEDKTEVTLALILSEDVKSKPQSVPLGTLRSLIQERGERLLSQLREGPIGRLIPGGQPATSDSEPPPSGEQAGAKEAAAGDGDKPVAGVEEKQASPAMTRVHEIVDASRKAMDQLQATFDEQMRQLMPGVGAAKELRSQVDTLTRRVEALEARIAKLDSKG